MIEIQSYEHVTQIRMSRELYGKAVYWTAAYLVDGLLIDTGCKHTSDELVEFLNGRDVRLVVNTHSHEDHVGANREVMNRFDAPVFAHPFAVPLIGQEAILAPYQEIAWGYPVPTTVQPIPDAVRTDRYTFHVIETPGHCSGHVCLLEPSQGWCFTGDLFLREHPKFTRYDENIGEIVKSMQRLLEISTERLILFTSVGKIVEDGRTALRACVDYFTGLSRKTRDLASSGASTDEIVKALFQAEHPFSEFTNGQFSTHNMIRSLLEMEPEERR